MGRVRLGWSLAAKSWNVIQADRELLLFPAASLLATLAAASVFFGPAAYSAAHHGNRAPFFVAGLLAAYPLSFISTYFGVAFVGVASRRLAGEPASVSDGFECANARLKVIAQWALLATLVGIAISLLERVRFGGIFARIAFWIAGAAWSVATFFVVPVLALEGKGPLEAAKEPASLVRKRWGEGVVGTTVIGGAFGLLLIPVMVIGVIGWQDFQSFPASGAFVLVVAIVLGLAVLVVQGAVDSLFRLALYDYAVADIVPAPFDLADVTAGLTKKKKR